MVKSKYEIRNSKQIRITEIQNRKKRCGKLQHTNSLEGMTTAKEMREQTEGRRRKTRLEKDITRETI
jgi:hypothetical protein